MAVDEADLAGRRFRHDVELEAGELRQALLPVAVIACEQDEAVRLPFLELERTGADRRFCSASLSVSTDRGTIAMVASEDSNGAAGSFSFSSTVCGSTAVALSTPRDRGSRSGERDLLALHAA